MKTPLYKDQLKKNLIDHHGATKGNKLLKKYVDSFEQSYCLECSPELISQDILYLEKISPTNFLELYFYTSENKTKSQQHLRIYKSEETIPLSKILPILGDFGFHVWSDRNYCIKMNNKCVWISDFKISSDSTTEMAFEHLRDLFHSALIAICEGYFISDKLNELILTVGLSWQEIAILRAYIKYLLQTNFHFSKLYIEKALVNNSKITKNLILLFKERFDPNISPKQKNTSNIYEESILRDLNAVSNLDDDLIIRHLISVIKATLRTNYFQHDINNNPLALSFI